MKMSVNTDYHLKRASVKAGKPQGDKSNDKIP